MYNIQHNECRNGLTNIRKYYMKLRKCLRNVYKNIINDNFKLKSFGEVLIGLSK